MNEALMASVLKAWGEPLSGMVERVEAGEKAAQKAFARLFKGTSGNFRRVYYFSQLTKQQPGATVDLKFIDMVLAKMVNQ